MKYMELARTLDHQGRPMEAAWAYEIALRQTDASLELYLDLVAIYFAYQDFGFSAAHTISQEVVVSSCWRMLAVLDEAEQRFGRHGEADAWRLYIRERVAGEDVQDAEYRRIAEDTGAPLAQFRLFLSTSGKEFADEVRHLQQKVKHPKTERERYIKSVLESSAAPLLRQGD